MRRVVLRSSLVGAYQRLHGTGVAEAVVEGSAYCPGAAQGDTNSRPMPATNRPLGHCRSSDGTVVAISMFGRARSTEQPTSASRATVGRAAASLMPPSRRGNAHRL